MRRETLLSFLCILCATFSPMNNTIIEKDELRVYSVTESSMNLTWSFGGRATPDFDGLVFTYRLANPVEVPRTLEWRWDVEHYRASPPRELFDWARFERLQIGKTQRPNDRVTSSVFILLTYSSEDRQINIYVSNLRFPETDYLFELIRKKPIGWVSTTGPPEWVPTNTRTEVTIAYVSDRTSPGPKRLEPPKTGNGLFQLNDVNATHRHVRVFWRWKWGKTRMNIYRRGKDGGYEETVAMNIDIEMADGHFDDYIDANAYEYYFSAGRPPVSGKVPCVNIPARGNYVPGPADMTRKGKADNKTFALRWKAPEGVTVYEYVVAWVDGHNQIVDSVWDFVYLNQRIPYIRIQLMEGDLSDFQLAVVVNTPTGSSGLNLYQPWE